MRSWIRDILLISICSAVIIASVYALYKELTVRIDKNSSDAIGTVIFKKKNTERKYAEYVIWEDIAASSPVYNYDSLRTFKGSAASIRLNSGAEISLDEDTMIVLISDEKGVKINFDRGTVSAKSGKVTGNISLNTKDASISISKGELAVKREGAGVDVNVSSGEALIDTGSGDVRKIDNHTSAQVINGKTEVKKVTVVPESPANNSRYITYKNSESIGFRWKSGSTGEETVQLSKDSSFIDIVYTSKSSAGSHQFNVIPGDYYWRVVSGAETSPVRKFTLIKDSVPEQVYPESGENLSVQENGEYISFKWSRSEHVSGYLFEIAQSRDMTKSLKKIEVSQNFISVEEIPAGPLYWTVTRIYPDSFILLGPGKFLSGFSLEKKITVKSKPKPIHDGEMRVSTLTENIILNWEGCAGIKDYTVDISPDIEFKKIIRSFSSNMTFYNAGRLPEGKYFWRVAANYGKGESLVSETVPLAVTRPEPVVYISPVNGSTLSNSAGSVRFAWKDNSAIGYYLFEISYDADFKKVIDSAKIAAQSYTLQQNLSGKIYWRVSIIDKNGSNIAKGRPSVFFMPEILAKPSVISPANMDVINLDNLDVIKFQWEKVAGADSYELEIFQRESGADRSLIVLNADTQKVELRNFKILNPGTLVWIVRAKKSVNGIITASSESGRNYFVLKVTEDISAPKSKVQGKIYVR